jgi:hypothetical protein|tara:strand:- start:1119 stop:1649 length:531 start_codon:yes stop_codon:yes gene_type:complete
MCKLRLEFRTAKEEDIDHLEYLEKECFEPELQASKEIMLARMRHSPEGFFIAFIDDKPVGYLCAMFVNDEHIEKLPEKVKENAIIDMNVPKGDNLHLISLGIIEEKRKYQGGKVITGLNALLDNLIAEMKPKQFVIVPETTYGHGYSDRIGYDFEKELDFVNSQGYRARLRIKNLQ